MRLSVSSSKLAQHWCSSVKAQHFFFFSTENSLKRTSELWFLCCTSSTAILLCKLPVPIVSSHWLKGGLSLSFCCSKGNTSLCILWLEEEAVVILNFFIPSKWKLNLKFLLSDFFFVFLTTFIFCYWFIWENPQETKIVKYWHSSKAAVTEASFTQTQEQVSLQNLSCSGLPFAHHWCFLAPQSSLFQFFSQGGTSWGEGAMLLLRRTTTVGNSCFICGWITNVATSAVVRLIFRFSIGNIGGFVV